MNCLCCGKSMSERCTLSEQENQWHDKCVSHFFGTKQMPAIDISENRIENLIQRSTKQGMMVTGVQKKLSLNLTIDDYPRLTLVGYPAGYILKPDTREYEEMPQAKFLSMMMAKAVGIKTVPFALIKSKSKDEKKEVIYAYITKRIDRISKDNQVLKLAMEDFCQLSYRLTSDKYRSSYERCGKIIDKYSSQAMLDKSEMFLRVIFTFATGNSDMHLKNFSLIERQGVREKYSLSDAYDMLPVNVILPTDLDDCALTVNGKKRNIKRNDFLILAATIGLREKMAENIIEHVIHKEDVFLTLCENSLLSEQMKQDFSELIKRRIGLLRKSS
ncbi:MAG: HipA domain-containing protein [Erysipelotrichaceae bacterium]